MSEEKDANNSTANKTVPMPEQEDERLTLVEKIGKTTYRVTVHFSTTSSENMSDKIKRMLRNEVQRM